MEIRINIDLRMDMDPATQIVDFLNQKYVTDGVETRLKIENNKIYVKETTLSDYILYDLKMECQPNTYVDTDINNVFVELLPL